MLRILDSPNDLLTAIVNFLHNKEGNVNRIKSMIQESTATKLVPAFAFLGNWIANHINSSDHEIDGSQPVFQLIGQIALKVPPVILLTGSFDLNWGMYQPHWHLRGFYGPINSRIIQLRSYIKPFSIYGQVLPISDSIQANNDGTSLSDVFIEDPKPRNETGKIGDALSFPGIALELDNDPAYQSAIFIHFKRLILNHAPIDEFKQLLKHRNSRTILTNAFIDILRDLNMTRDATQEELIFGFSSVFLYINAFALANQIDGQMLSEFLQSRPFLSPFCILAMVNHIPTNMYLFNLLTPKELLIKNDTQQSEINPSQYVMVDFSTNNPLDDFVQKIPQFLSNYFLSAGSLGEPDGSKKKDDNEFLSFIHLPSASLYNKIKTVVTVSHERQLGPLHVSAMGIMLLRCITLSLQKTLDETKIFTDNFCGFVKTVFAVLSPAFADQLAVKFYDSLQTQDKLINLTIKGSLSHLFPILLHHPTNQHLVPFCINASKFPEAQQHARLMITKLLQCEKVKLNQTIVKALKKCEDPMILLEYIDAIPNSTHVENCEVYEDMMGVRNHLLKKLQITPLMQPGSGFVIESINCTQAQQPILYAIDNMTSHSAIKDVTNLIRQHSSSTPSIYRVLCMTNYLQNRDFASFFVEKIKLMLAEDAFYEDGKSKFEQRPCDFALPIAQSLLGRLLSLSHMDLASELLTAMTKCLSADPAPLHWITRFSHRYRSMMPKYMLQTFDRIVSTLPCADELYIRSSNYPNPNDMIYHIASLLVENDILLIQNPDSINREYQSPYEHAQAFANCSLSFSAYTDEQIATMLTEPIFNFGKAWHTRDLACLCLAKLTATMNSEISYGFFSILMQKKSCEMGLLAGRLFLVNAKIDVFKRICQNCQSLINKDNNKLDFFMRMIMPSFQRLKGDNSVATSLLCGFLESITENSPRVIQESVIDAVGIVYIKMKLYKSRPSLINSAINFKADLKGIIASSLETMPEDNMINPRRTNSLSRSQSSHGYTSRYF